jgi:hypothetical protein
MGGSGGTASDLNELKKETGSSFSEESPFVRSGMEMGVGVSRGPQCVMPGGFFLWDAQ